MKRAWPFAAPAAALLALGPVLRNGFVNWDDHANVLRNPWLGTPSALREAFTSTHYGHFQPLAWLSLSLDRALWGLDPFGFHLSNLLLHAAAAFVLFKLLEAVTADAPAAALGACLWAAHPLRVEPVAWVTERRELLATLFLLCSALLHVRGRRGGALLAYGAACLSKVTAAVFPFALIAYELWRGRRLAESAREKTAFLALSALTLGLGVRAQHVSGTAVPLSLFSPADRLAQAAFGPGYYAWKTLFPSALNPFVYADRLADPGGYYPYAALLLPLAAASWALRARRGFAPAAFAALLFLLPSLGFFKSGPQTAADRFAHMATIPLLLPAAFAFARSRAARLGAALSVLALVPLSRAQCAVWRDSVSLWTAAFERSRRPPPLVLQNLASALREAGREEQAAPLLARLSAEAPESPAAWALRGERSFEAGDLAGAEAAFRGALARNADMPGVRVNHGLALFRLGRHAEAEAEFARAAEQDPGSAEAWHNLGLCRARRGAAPEAEDALARALALSPGRADTLRVRALLRGTK